MKNLNKMDMFLIGFLIGGICEIISLYLIQQGII